MAWHGTPSAGVRTVITVIAQDEVLIFGESTLNINLGTDFNVRLLQECTVGVSFVVDMDLTITDLDSFTGCSNDSLDKRDGDVLWPFEDDDITALGFTEAVGHLVDNNIFIVMEVWFHRRSGDIERLDEEKPDHKGYAQDSSDSFEHIVDK